MSINTTVGTVPLVHYKTVSVILFTDNPLTVIIPLNNGNINSNSYDTSFHACGEGSGTKVSL